MKFIVTDPCYLVHGENGKGTWTKFINAMNDNVEDAEKILCDFLGVSFLKFDSTLYGDWENSIHFEKENDNDNIIDNMFYADSGMVCVTEYTQKMEQEGVIGAIFECNGIKEVEFDDDNPRWMVVRIKTINNSIIESEQEYIEDDY